MKPTIDFKDSTFQLDGTPVTYPQVREYWDNIHSADWSQAAYLEISLIIMGKKDLHPGTVSPSRDKNHRTVG